MAVASVSVASGKSKETKAGFSAGSALGRISRVVVAKRMEAIETKHFLVPLH